MFMSCFTLYVLRRWLVMCMYRVKLTMGFILTRIPISMVWASCTIFNLAFLYARVESGHTHDKSHGIGTTINLGVGISDSGVIRTWHQVRIF